MSWSGRSVWLIVGRSFFSVDQIKKMNKHQTHHYIHISATLHQAIVTSLLLPTIIFCFCRLKGSSQQLHSCVQKHPGSCSCNGSGLNQYILGRHSSLLIFYIYIHLSLLHHNATSRNSRWTLSGVSRRGYFWCEAPSSLAGVLVMNEFLPLLLSLSTHTEERLKDFNFLTHYLCKGFMPSVAALPKSRQAPAWHTQTQSCPMQIHRVVTMWGMLAIQRCHWLVRSGRWGASECGKATGVKANVCAHLWVCVLKSQIVSNSFCPCLFFKASRVSSVCKSTRWVLD